MAWTSILATTLALGKPIRAIDIRAIYNNLAALANGDSGAPRIRNAAIQAYDLSIDRLQQPFAGDSYYLGYLIGDDPKARLTQNSAYGGVWQSGPGGVYFITPQFGSIRIRVQHYTSVNTVSTFLRVLRNGVVQAEWSTNSTSPVERVLDVACSPNDVFTVQHRGSGAEVNSYMKHLRVLADKPGLPIIVGQGELTLSTELP